MQMASDHLVADRHVFLPGTGFDGGGDKRGQMGLPKTNARSLRPCRSADARQSGAIREPPGNLRKPRTAWWRRQSSSTPLPSRSHRIPFLPYQASTMARSEAGALSYGSSVTPRGKSQEVQPLFRPAVLQVPGLGDIVVPAFGLARHGRCWCAGSRLVGRRAWL
jgi:hypothetical protein